VTDDDDPLLGKTLGGYTIDRRIGSGATGVVYAARDAAERVVAVKVLNEALGQIRSLRRRFEREARALSKLQHHKIVHIEDFGVVEEIVFIAMEYLEGETLEDRITREPIDAERALDVTRQVLTGVAFAHARQIVHRDLKPANVFLLSSGSETMEAKVLDFGLAKFLSIEELSQEGTLTRRGRVVGTPAYMAPEQITGVSLDLRADVYAVGIMLFELLADRRPFDSERRSKLLRAHLFEEVPKLASVRPGLVVDPALEAVVHRALAKDPADRYADAAELLQALEPFDGSAATLARAPRGRKRKRANSSSVVLSPEELADASSEDERPADPQESEPSITAVRGDVPLGGLPSVPPPSVEVRSETTQKTRTVTAKTEEVSRTKAPRKPGEPTWRDAGWVTALVWILGLGLMGAVVALAAYATTVH
jgi:serine/threonine-protein kinase